VFSLVPPLSTGHCPHLLLSAVLRRLQLVCSAGAGTCRSIFPACNDSSSKSAGHRCYCRWMGQTDGRTDRQTSGHLIDLALHTTRAIKAVMLLAGVTPLTLPLIQNFSYHISSPSWWSGTAVERRSLTGELSLSCARPAADG